MITRDDSLSVPEFRARHRVLGVVALVHAPVLVALGLLGTASWAPGVLAPVAVVLLVLAGADARMSRRQRCAATSAALLVASAAVVAVASGSAESQMHVLVVVALIAAYQSVALLTAVVSIVAVAHLAVLLGAEVLPPAPVALVTPAWAVVHVGAVAVVGLAMLAVWRSADADRRLAWESGARPTYGVDEHGVIRHVNSALFEVMGVEPARLVGWDHHQLLHPGAGETCAVCAAIRRREPLDAEQVQLVSADGELFDAEVTVRPFGGVRRPAARGRSGGRTPRPTGATVTFSDVSTRVEAERQLEKAARSDSLTGLGNRALLDQSLPGMIVHEAALGRRIAMIEVNVDRFRTVNDTLSHSSGDRLLAEIARRVRHATPIDALVTRTGGDEFTAVIPDALPDQVMACAERIRATVSEPVDVGPRVIEVTASIGAVIVPGEATDPGSLLADADLALQESRSAGGNRVSRYDMVMRARADARIAFASDLHDAVEAGAFTLEYQPTWRLGQRRIDGCEALLRWRHPERGVIPPAGFIPMAEETGVILPLGRWVISEACRQLDAWHRDPSLPDLQLAVNLSAAQLRDASLVDHVDRTLAAAAFPAGRLVLEITETVLMEDLEVALPVLGELRARGVVLAIDDFGTGFSSLSMLRNLPVQVVKIDRHFLQGLATDALGQRVVSSIIDLARALGLSVVAEGVETAEDLRIVEGLGADVAQGYALGLPMSADDLVRTCHRDERLRFGA